MSRNLCTLCSEFVNQGPFPAIYVNFQTHVINYVILDGFTFHYFVGSSSALYYNNTRCDDQKIPYRSKSVVNNLMYFKMPNYDSYTVALATCFTNKATVDPTLKRKSVSGKSLKIYLLFTNA